MNEWDRLPGESGLWYERFDIYRLAGSGRSLDATYRLVSDRTEGRAGAVWRKTAEKWRWQERAEAWDAVEREKLRAEEEERRRAAREERLKLLGEARKAVWTGLENANLAKLSEEEARSMLGTLRIFFFDALKGERLELGEPTEIVRRDSGPAVDDKTRRAIEKVYGDES